MSQTTRYPNMSALFSQRPHACAKLQGSEHYPTVEGNLRFYQTPYGVFLLSEVRGLPVGKGACESRIFALHIHEGTSCTPQGTDAPFSDSLTHYNPHDCPHPYHAGDLPPLFGAGPYAYSAVLSDRFRLYEVIGKTVILHAMLDDFTTQPSGGAGEKIACGVIMAL